MSTAIDDVMKRSAKKDKEVIKRLVAILRDNPYSQHLRSVGLAHHLEDYHVTLNLDQRTYNVSSTSEVAVVWIEGSELLVQF